MGMLNWFRMYEPDFQRSSHIHPDDEDYSEAIPGDVPGSLVDIELPRRCLYVYFDEEDL